MSELDAFLRTPILEPLDPERAEKLISAPPFVRVPGVVNFRDIGGLPVSTPDGKRFTVRKGRMYRSATLNDITPEGKAALYSLNIGAVFDLRTLKEVRKYANISPGDLDPRAGLVNLTMEDDIEAEGINVYHIPLVDLSKQDQKAEFAQLLKYGGGDDGFLEGYSEMLELGGGSYGAIVRYILEQTKEDAGGKACLWHCHAGKDRTGVFSALVLELLGVSDEAIAQDYALTRAGLEPARAALIEQFKELIATYPHVAIGIASSNASLMLKFLEMLRTKYGGARGYFKERSGLTDVELDELRAALLVDGPE